MKEEETNEFRLYPNGDAAFKEFVPRKTSFKVPIFSFDETEIPELGTAREIKSEE